MKVAARGLDPRACKRRAELPSTMRRSLKVWTLSVGVRRLLARVLIQKNSLYQELK